MSKGHPRYDFNFIIYDEGFQVYAEPGYFRVAVIEGGGRGGNKY